MQVEQTYFWKSVFLLQSIRGCLLFYFIWRDSPQWARASSFTRVLEHTQRRTTVGRTPLDEWSVRRRDLYLTTHNTHNGQTSIPRVGFEPAVSAGERLQTYALDRAVTGSGDVVFTSPNILILIIIFNGWFIEWEFVRMFYVLLHSQKSLIILKN